MIKLKLLLLEDVYEYFYHFTTTKTLPGIVKHGLIPSSGNTNWGGDLGKFSEGKIFVTNKFRSANYYGNIVWKNDVNRYRPILRFKYNKLRFIPDKNISDETPSTDFYVEYPIKAKFELFVYTENTKIQQEYNGDTWFDENTGNWRLLTMDLAESIASGEWDGEEQECDGEECDYIDETEYPLAKGKELQSYGGMEDWKGKLIWMSPDKFLSLVHPLPNYEINDKSYKNLKKRIKKQLPIDFLVLEIDVEKRKVIGHEGRHRATVAKELGIEKVPVLIYTGSGFKRVPDWGLEDHEMADKAEFKPEWDKS